MTDLVNWLDAHVKAMFFEATMGTGPLLCDGRVCDSGRSCNGAERWFCRDVIRKVVPSGHFTGQCKIKLPSRDRFFDFAIETREGKRINVEVDGYTYHAGPDVPEEKRGDDILREREAQDAGWTVRHYTFDAFKNDAEKCKRDLLSVMNERIDMSNKKFEEILSFNKTPVLKGRCPNQECDGQVCRKFHHGNKEFFWQCSKCKNPYNTNKYASFPHNAITPMSKWDDRYGIANSESTQKMTRAD
ncbi:MAG: hypothetical protein LBC79_07020 [Deltaproteobacteria bacterium]|jgi:very-short-patch-repair endonuclease|nr:hypothetical protein [Deltaproteobacteria bacterium]